MTSRNVFLGDLKEHAPEIAFGSYSGGVKSLLFNTVPPTKKNVLKICFSPFHKAEDSFSFFKNHVPGLPPGTLSWETSRNTVLK